ncbi:MAG: S9 family peptidase [Pseudomonadota bacterium]
MRVIGLVLISLLFGSAVAQADYPKPPLEAYGALPQISSAEISPDGSKIAMIANFENGTRVLVSEVGGGIIQQIGIDDLKARGLEFYDNEHVVLRVSETTTTYKFRGEYEYSGAYSINIETLEDNQLISHVRDLFPAQSGLGQIVGRGEKPGEVLMPAYIGARYTDPDNELLVAKLDSHIGHRYLRGEQDVRDWFVGDGGRVLARIRYNDLSNLFRVQWHLGTGGWKDIFSAKAEIPPFSILGVTPDESGLVFIRDSDDSEMLMKIASDGEISGPLLPASERSIDTVFGDDNRKILGVRYAGLVADYAFLDSALQDGYDAIAAQLPNATINLDSWSDDRSRLLYHVFDPSLGDAWLIQNRDDNTLSVLSSLRPDIPTQATGYLMSVEYKARDGLPIQAIITVPPSYNPQSAEPLPALVLPHGGPAAYDGFDFHWMAQYFANRGYVIVQPNFRGSAGFGRDFEDAGRGEWGGKMQDDITDGVNALVKAGMIDPERVCIAGASYGGYAALAGATFTPDLYKCVIAIAPVSDLNRMLLEEKRDHGRDHWVVSYWEDVMADGEPQREKLESISPVNFAEAVSAPVLLIHGDDDTVVPYDQSMVMERALRRAGKQVELIKLKGEDHWLSGAATRVQTLQEMDRFIAQHLPISE